MRMDKKTLALPMVILIALSIVGLGVAHWSDEITIIGTVKMGTLTVAFTEIEPPVEYKRLANGSLDPTEGGKPWVCNTTSYLDEHVIDPHTDKEGWKKLYINITNAYPCYEVHQTFIIKAIGDIPADIYAFNVTDCAELTWVQNMSALPEFRGWFVDANNKTIITLRIVDSVLPRQLHPCEENKMELDIHIEQDALECHTYCFVVEILYTQPN